MSNNLSCFSPFRPVGIVCGSLPCSVTQIQQEPFILIPFAKTTLLYRGNSLFQVRGGPPYDSPVVSASHSGKRRLVALRGGQLRAYSGSKPVWSGSHHPLIPVENVRVLTKDDLMWSIGDDGRIVTWNGRTGECLCDFLMSSAQAKVTSAIIPSHYTNKLLIATDDGSLSLYNFRKGKLLISFSPKLTGEQLDLIVSSQNSLESTESSHPIITAMSSSQIKDLIALGFQSGQILLFHLQQGRVLSSFSSLHPVTALSFRGNVEDSLLASGSAQGELFLWDLRRGCGELRGVLSSTKEVASLEELSFGKHAHDGAVIHTLAWIGSLLISIGSNNTLKQYRFDTASGLGLLNRQRAGHVGPCSLVHFLNDRQLLSCGSLDRSFRVTHLFSNRASWELSQRIGRHHRNQRAPPAMAVASCEWRENSGPSLVSIHDTSSCVCLWRLDQRILEDSVQPVVSQHHFATALTLSDDGGWALVGYSSGHLCRVAVQGKHDLLHFVPPCASRAHDGEISHLCIFQHLNLVASVGSSDQHLRQWNLSTGQLIKEQELEVPIPAISEANAFYKNASLWCLGCGDGALRIYSFATSSTDRPGQHTAAPVVRIFRGHSAPITAVAWAPDTFRYLVSASADGCVFVWSVPSAQCVNLFKVTGTAGNVSPISSLSFHPDALFLASTHVGESGLFLWTNHLRHGHVPEAISITTESLREATELVLPIYPQPETREHLPDSNKKVESSIFSGQSLLEWRLSEQGLSYWATLPRLEEIVRQQAAILPPKKPSRIPFFLQSATKPETAPAVSDEIQQRIDESSSIVLTDLANAVLSSKYSEARDLLFAQTPTAIDAELRQFLLPGEEDLTRVMTESNSNQIKANCHWNRQAFLDQTAQRDLEESNVSRLKSFLHFLSNCASQSEQIDFVHFLLKRSLSLFSWHLMKHAPLLAKELNILTETIQENRDKSINLFDVTASLTDTFATAV